MRIFATFLICFSVILLLIHACIFLACKLPSLAIGRMSVMLIEESEIEPQDFVLFF